MALATYSDLCASVADWMHRTDLTAKIPDFVKLAENRLNRKLALLQQETETTLTATIGSRLMAKPVDLSVPMALWLTTYQPRKAMEMVIPTRLPVTVYRGLSNYFTVTDTNIEVENPADLEYTYNFRYVAQFDLATQLTNSLLTDYPDTYLYCTLEEAAIWTSNDDLLAKFSQKAQIAIKDSMSQSQRTKGQASLRTDFPGSQRHGNILRGY